MSKLTTTKSTLLSALKHANAPTRKRTLPILSCALLAAEKDSVSIRGTDFDSEAIATFEAKTDRPFVAAIPAQKLIALISSMPEGDLSIETGKTQSVIIKWGEGSYEIFTLNPDEFPPPMKAENPKTFSMKCEELATLFRKTAFSAFSDPSARPNLCGVHFSADGKKLALEACNGHTLAQAWIECAGCLGDFILPSEAVALLRGQLSDDGNVALSFSDKLAIFEFPAGDVSMRVTSRIVDGSYPNTKQIPPTQIKGSVQMPRLQLIETLTRVALMADESFASVKLEFSKNNLAISSASPRLGNASESVAIKFNGKPLAIAFTPEYLVKGLNSFDSDDVEFGFIDKLSPAVMRGERSLYVLMPRNISGLDDSKTAEPTP
jgi:DNA polymerase-3 subunit beta